MLACLFVGFSWLCYSTLLVVSVLILVLCCLVDLLLD